MNPALSAAALQFFLRSGTRRANMAAPRKVFRIEEMHPTATPAIAVEADDPQQREILAELKALHELMARQTSAPPKIEIDPAAIEASGLRQLKDETDTIHRAIIHTKQEIAMLHAGTFSDGRPRATRELDAVVDGTERATKQILDAAEVIEEAANSLAASVKQGQEKALAQDIQDHVLRIFEACNFQDLGGQRIAKVMATLQFIESRIACMMEIWGGVDAFKDYAAAAAAESQREEPGLLQGPKL